MRILREVVGIVSILPIKNLEKEKRNFNSEK